jgi:hypothetical protein
MATAKKETTKAAAKAAIDAIEAVEAPDAGIPEEKTLEELVADKYIQVLTEPLKDHTGPNDRNDFTFIPEYIRDDYGNTRQITKRVRVMGHTRVISLDGNYFYRWCHPDKFAKHRRRGFDFVPYDELFKDATYFQKTTEKHIRNGDVYLMKIGVEGMARMLREKMELQRHFQSVHEGEVAGAAEDYNTKALRIHPDGTSENIN